MPKSYSMQGQLSVGAMGVQIAKTVLRSRYPEIEDLQNNKAEQKRGIDLYVQGLGYLEVKTDSHSPRNLFLELEVSGKPGAVDRSAADYFCVLFYRWRVVYLIPRPELQKWMRENYAWILEEHPGWVKIIRSRAGRSRWSAKGIALPRRVLMEDILVKVIEWTEEEEALVGATWKEA